MPPYFSARGGRTRLGRPRAGRERWPKPQSSLAKIGDETAKIRAASPRASPLKETIVSGIGVKIERPLVDNQIYGDAVVGSDLHIATIALNMDVICDDRDIFVLSFFEDGGANIVNRLAIYGSKAGRAFDGILELHVIDENRDDLDTDVDDGDDQTEEKNELKAAGASLGSHCQRMPLNCARSSGGVQVFQASEFS